MSLTRIIRLIIRKREAERRGYTPSLTTLRKRGVINGRTYNVLMKHNVTKVKALTNNKKSVMLSQKGIGKTTTEQIESLSTYLV